VGTRSEDEPIALPAASGLSFSQRLWSEEVALATAREGVPIDSREPSYEFSNGRKFLADG